MSYLLMPMPKQQFIDANGAPLSGGKVYVYKAGTLVASTTYTDASGATANPNPVILDTSGRCSIWITEAVKVMVYDADDVLVLTQDNITVAESTVTTVTVNQFPTSGLTVAYGSSTQFTTPTDKTATFPVGTRVRCTITSGYIYGTVTAVSYAGGTTTVTCLWDSGSIDNTITAADAGILTSSNNAIPISPATSTTVTDTFTIAETNKIHTFNSASDINLTLPAAAAWPSGSWMRLKNINTGVVTILSTVDGVANIKLYPNNEITVFSNGSSLYGTKIDPYTVPIGSIVAFSPGYFTNGSNAGFTYQMVSANTVAAVNTLLNPSGWYACDGSALNLTGSPIFGAASRYLPNLTDDRFLMGDTVCGGIGGDNEDDLSHTHTTGSHALSLAEIPAHTHTVNYGSSSGTSMADGGTGTGGTFNSGSAGSGNSHNHGSTGSSGSATHENRPVFLSCIYIIKVK